MPELPEVEHVRRQLLRTVGRTVVGHESGDTRRSDGLGPAVGRTIVDIARRGKILTIRLDRDDHVAIHLGMSGRVTLGPRHDDVRHVRGRLDLDDGDSLTFIDPRGFGRIVIVRDGRRHPKLPLHGQHGPEPSDATAEGLLRRGRRSIKAALLDQRTIAGVGNIYADETLWQVRIHPARRCDELTNDDGKRILAALRAKLEAAISRGGTTLRDHRGIDGKAGANQHHLDVYGRAGLPCRRCAAPITTAHVAGRTSSICATCQRPPSA